MQDAGPALRLEAASLGGLFDSLIRRGYRVVGPTVRDGAIVYDEIASPADLPAGWTDEQDGGRYRLERRSDGALFGYAVGPHSWKKYLHPPWIRLWRAERRNGGFEILAPDDDDAAYAFVGVRACEIAAIAIQDRVFLEGEHVDPVYRRRRRKIFVVAVRCGAPAGTCFCVSMDTGPGVSSGFDLALTEVQEDGRHYFVVESGSGRGREVAAELEARPATAAETGAADAVVDTARRRMGRTLDTDGIQELLYRNYRNPHWQEVADRCLACTNCTLVCPTCFCTSVEDVSELGGEAAERWRGWDSCFSSEFTYIHGGSSRHSIRSRYRQWLTHKLGTWHEQFGTSGCVGCGRCITWCPVGIDLTEEAAALRATDGDGGGETSR